MSRRFLLAILVPALGLASATVAALVWRGETRPERVPEAGARGPLTLLPRLIPWLAAGLPRPLVDDGGAALGGPCNGDDDCAAGDCCDATCVDLEADPAHCGGCEAPPCGPKAVCRQGECEPGCAEAGCPRGFACVGEGDLRSCLPTDCRASPDGGACAQSSGDEGVCCGGSCVDPDADARHCGGCGLACDAGAFCREGRCLAAPDCRRAEAETPCPGASRAAVCCDGRCVDELADAQNCGTCGVACPAEERCTQGACVTTSCRGQPADTPCAGADSRLGACCRERCAPLTEFRSDPQNCGACDQHCPAGAQCENEQCVEPDGGDELSCKTAGCPQGDTCTKAGTCVRGNCSGADDSAPCAAPGVDEGTCCGQSCSDLGEDQQNCGRCGVRCDAGEFCFGGSCEAFGSCAEAGDLANCPLRQSHDGVCCGGECVDAEIDPQHCGNCATVCRAHSLCRDGQCLATDCGGEPSGGLCLASGGDQGSCCRGRCLGADGFTADRDNCGGCGVACPPGSACAQASCTGPDGGDPVSCLQSGCPRGQSCIHDLCVTEGCDAATEGLPCGASGAALPGLCCGQRCTEVARDPQNCGSCGTVCPPGDFCALGTCTEDSRCDGGDGLCQLADGTAGGCCGGGCLAIATDPRNCGRCGRQCPAGVACRNYQCETDDGLPDPGGDPSP